jgi:hypothetical protein
LLFHAGDGTLTDLESLCDCDLRLLARLAQLMEANAIEFGVSFAL